VKKPTTEDNKLAIQFLVMLRDCKQIEVDELDKLIKELVE